MERTLQELGDELLEYCIRGNIYDLTNNQVQRILKIGHYRTSQVVKYLEDADKVVVFEAGRIGII